MRKSLLGLLMMVAALCGTGCMSTPAYSGHERGQMIARNMNFEGAQIQDDIDSLLLLRPNGRLTIWHIR